MTSELVTATAELVMAIKPQPMQAKEKFDAADIALLLEQGGGKVLLVDGQPVAAGGTVPLGKARRFAWMVVGADAGAHLLPIIRTLRANLDRHVGERVEMTMLTGWDGADQWARLLGFEYRETLRAADHLGRDHDLYVRGG